jgi:molybdopterin-binding protein
MPEMVRTPAAILPTVHLGNAPGQLNDFSRIDPALVSELTWVTPLVDRRGSMALSARNHLPGIIEEIVRDTILAHVVVRVGDALIESVITRRSADDLQLKKGDAVTAVVKATEVMIAKP